MLIALEGIDASGKATQARMLAENLKASTYDFPHYQTITGQAIRGLLTGKWDVRTKSIEQAFYVDVKDLPPEDVAEWVRSVKKSMSSFGVRSDLVSPDRVRVEFHDLHAAEKQHAAEIRALVLQSLMTTNRLEVGPMLSSYARSVDRHLVLDRYYASGLAYGSADGLPFEYLVDIHKLIPPADLWIYIDIPPEESKRRRPERRDEYEAREGFMTNVRERYLDLFGAFDGTKSTVDGKSILGGKWVIVDGLGSPYEIHERIINEVRSIL